MAMYRALVTLNMTSGLNEDAATNTWYFDADDLTELGSAYTALREFYIDVSPRMSNLIDATNCTVEFYQLSDPEPRTPVLMYNMSGLVPAASSGPTEVALVLSYQGEKVSGLPQSRRRGRVYIGPLYGLLEARPNSAILDSFEDAGQALLDASVAATGWTWAQYSPTNGTGINVANGWVDNEWDTQRRRGRKATARQTFSA